MASGRMRPARPFSTDQLEGVMAQPDSDQPAEQFCRDRHDHGGIPGHIYDDRLARLTEEERVTAGPANGIFTHEGDLVGIQLAGHYPDLPGHSG